MAAFLLHKTSFGFKVYATGGNEEAARLSGINTGRVRIITFILVGMSAALAGIIQMAYLRGVTPTAGQGMELTAIASSVIGGTSMFGGVGTIAGSFIGTLFMGVVRNGLVLMGTNAYIIDLIIGIVLIGAVWFSTFSTRETVKAPLKNLEGLARKLTPLFFCIGEDTVPQELCCTRAVLVIMSFESFVSNVHLS